MLLKLMPKILFQSFVVVLGLVQESDVHDGLALRGGRLLREPRALEAKIARGTVKLSYASLI